MQLLFIKSEVHDFTLKFEQANVMNGLPLRPSSLGRVDVETAIVQGQPHLDQPQNVGSDPGVGWY
jgi:hypothetical protein